MALTIPDVESAPYASSNGASEVSSCNKRQTAQGMTGNDVAGAHGITQNPATNQGKQAGGIILSMDPQANAEAIQGRGAPTATIAAAATAPGPTRKKVSSTFISLTVTLIDIQNGTPTVAVLDLPIDSEFKTVMYAHDPITNLRTFLQAEFQYLDINSIDAYIGNSPSRTQWLPGITAETLGFGDHVGIRVCIYHFTQV